MGFLPVCLLLITPKENVSYQLISFSALLPAIFLLIDWHQSSERKGLMGIITRGGGTPMVLLAEWVVPALAGAVISSVVVFTVASPPPWQYWITTVLSATSFSIVFLLTEQYAKYAGRVILGLLWIWQISEKSNNITDFVFFTDYSSAVLAYDTTSSSHHPDSFVLASIIVISLAATTYILLRKRQNI